MRSGRPRRRRRASSLPPSAPPGFDGGTHVAVRERPSRSPANPLLRLAKARNGATNVVEPMRTLGHEPGHGLVVARDDDFLALQHTLEQLAEPDLGVERSHSCHRVTWRFSQSLTSLAWSGPLAFNVQGSRFKVHPFADSAF